MRPVSEEGRHRTLQSPRGEAAVQLVLDLRKRAAGTTATGTQLYLFGSPWLTVEGEYGRCLCGRLSTDGTWGPPYIDELEDGSLVVLEDLWHCKRCSAKAFAEYSRRLDVVQDLERELGLGRARPYRPTPQRTAHPAHIRSHG